MNSKCVFWVFYKIKKKHVPELWINASNFGLYHNF